MVQTRLIPNGIFEVFRACLKIGLVVCTIGARAEEIVSPKLGEHATTADIAAHNTMVFPGGEGLPQGRGNAVVGEKLYLHHCVVCHGPNGRGGSGGELAGGHNALTSEFPDQNIGTYWPYATTLFDFIRRAMPMNSPGSLNDDEVYALTAYLLFENGLLAPDAVLDATTLAAIKMPNRNGFIWIDAQPPSAK
jgi:mono/diheme cytochrome c family protein